MIYNPFGEYSTLTPCQLWDKYEDYRQGKEEQPETVGQWTQNSTHDSTE